MGSENRNAFEQVQLARHPDRPYTGDLLDGAVFTDFIELHGDRRYSDDAALIAGFGRIGSRDVLVLGQQKGRDTNQRRHRNFGMPKPEGYRKALRFMKLAEKFDRPVVTFIDTPGAYPGIDAEERGQAEAIAYNLREMASLKVPVISVVLGEGGSGGALAIGIGDRVLMLENAVYSVISPEGCAAILWKDAGQAERAAESLGLTAEQLLKHGVIDEIVKEKYIWKVCETGDDKKANARTEKEFTTVSNELKGCIERNLKKLCSLSKEELVRQRFKKFRGMGSYSTTK